MKNEQKNPSDFPMDYDSLRQEGIRLIEKLGSKQWTDYNTHDPGITILEQLCYALTDLVYRIDYPVQDILAEGGADPYASLIPPKEILPSGLVTLLDMRKIVLDVKGVRNAWVERFTPEFNNAEPPIYWNRQNKTLTLFKDAQTEPLIIQGLYQVWVEAENKENENKKQNEAMIEQLEKSVRERLQTYRSVCEDFNVTVLKDEHIEKIGITASIEVNANANIKIYDIRKQIENYFSPPVHFYSLDEHLDKIKYFDEVFEGPLLSNGFIDNEEVKKNIRRTELRTSDLIQMFMNIQGVLAVRNISFVKTGNTSEEKWLLKLEKGKIPRLDKDEIDLIPRDHAAVPVSTDKNTTALPHSSGIPTGQNRHINDNYFSIQQQFPDCYGINSRGLSNSASPSRKAQAKQLKAYLLLFDQLLANEFAQLANAGKLFSFWEEHADTKEHNEKNSTYFFKLPDNPEFRFDAEQERLSLLKDFFNESKEKELERKNRFLDHLSARFAEQLADYSQESKNISNDIERKKKWLRNYAAISRNRANSYCKPADADNRTGLERRLRLKFDIHDSEPFYLIEHILLRPIIDDLDDHRIENSHAILSNIQRNNDPYSLQITIVHRAEYCALRSYIREEIPAHLNVNFYPHWEEDEKKIEKMFNDISEVYLKWRQAMMNDDSPNRQKLRATRDRLIDLLGIGETYPLADLEVSGETVDYGKKASICINFSQDDVSYQLFNENSKDAVLNDGELITATGNGGKVCLTTSPVTGVATYIIRASKKNNPERYVFLANKAKVQSNTDLQMDILFNKDEESVSIKILESQKATFYHAYIREITDKELIYEKKQENFLEIAENDIYIKQPEWQAVWNDPLGYMEVEGKSSEGNGGEVELKLGVLRQDSLIIIKARKQHHEGEFQLKKSLLFLVRPDIHKTPTLKVYISNSELHSLEVSNGEAGVFYHFRLEKDGDEICLPAFFHQWEDGDNSENKGIERLMIGRDFVIADSETKPEYIELKLDQPLQINEESLLYIRARKSRTNVWIDLEPRKLSEIK